MDGNQELGTVAVDKAVTVARFRRPTMASDADKPGGLPILIDGKIIGAIGIGGGRAPQDAQVAEAGLAAIKWRPLVAAAMIRNGLYSRPVMDLESRAAKLGRDSREGRRCLARKAPAPGHP
jgi:hypothetical protein